MAKKKKQEAKKENGIKVELTGILLILLSIIGIARLGIVGKFVQAFATFLVGEIYNVLLLFLIFVGLYLIIKRKQPNYFNNKLLGLYLLLIVVVVWCHLDYFKDINNIHFTETLKGSWDDIYAFVENPAYNLNSGGILGAILGFTFIKLFDIEGTKVVLLVLIICSIIIITGKSLIDLIKEALSKAKIKRTKKEEHKDKLEITKVEEEYENDNRVVVSSMEELINYEKKDEAKEEKVESTEDNNKVVDTTTSSKYFYPPIDLLNKATKNNSKENELAIRDNAPVLEKVLKDFGVEGKVVSAHVGPAVTQYEVEIASGTKVNKVINLNKEISLALAAKEVRIHPIGGKKTIGIEIPNKKISMVTVREILERIPSDKKESKLLVTLGRDIMGNPQYCEINKTPHLLVAGATGSGKSVCINSMITSILMRAKPDEVKLILIDPKKVELSIYNGVPHLLAPVVTDARKANVVLKNVVKEMERRYDLFEETGNKNIAGYNLYLEKKNKNLPEEEQAHKLPYMVVIIDELADLMLVAAKEVEDSIMRITQMARAAGIHLIVATQRPSTDVITGVVKANIPSRIAFTVSSQIDSRTIIDMAGAEKLLGKGDMLFLPQGENAPIRIQGTFIDDDEIKNVVDYVIKQQKARYDESILLSDEEKTATTMVEDDDYEEPLYNEIVEFVVTTGKASASLLQRKFRLGYNRAARCMDLLEERGIVGPQNGSKPREVLVKLDKEEE